jgi:hypothetical protein
MAPCVPNSSNQYFVVVSGLVQLSGTNFCLDAGSTPANGVQMKLWQCYIGLSQQTFNFQGGSAGLIQTANSESAMEFE